MAELTQVEPRRVSVVADGRRRDVVVDGRARLGDVLDGLGLTPTAEALAPDGSRVARTAALLDVTDGAVLLAVDGEHVRPSHHRAGGAFSAAHAPGSRAGHDDDGGPSPAAPAGGPAPDVPSGLRLRVLAGVALALLALAATVVLLAGPDGSAAAGAVVLVGAFMLAWAATGPWTLGVAVAGGGVGAGLLGLGVLGGLPAGSAQLTLLAAALGATVAAVFGRVPDPLTARCRRSMVAAGLLTAVGAVLTLGAGLPVTVLAAGALGLAVLLARVLPDLVVRLDDGATVDLDRLATTAWSPRPRSRRPRRWRLRRADLDEQVTAATTHQRVVLAGLLAVVVLAAGALVVAGPGSRTAIAVLLAAAGAGLALVARRYHGSADRWLLRLAGFASLAASGAVTVEGLGGGALAVGGASVVVGIALVLLAPLAGRGWTSLTLSRLADLLEAVCVAAALPLAVWAAGLVPWIRSLTG